MVSVYQRTVYSSSSGDMLNIKRLVVSVTALSSDDDWYVVLEFDYVENYMEEALMRVDWLVKAFTVFRYILYWRVDLLCLRLGFGF